MEDFKGFDITFSLAGKTALITGAGAGIGQAIAVMFGQKGATVILADLNPDACKGTAERMGGAKTFCIQCDVSSKDSIDKAVAEARALTGVIDILVNSAGVGLIDAAENLSLDYWNKTMDVNLRGSFLMAQAVGNIMIKQKRGKIINMASQGAVVALEKHIAYNASKAGIVAITKVMAMEWGKHNIQVNAISPTVILTEMGKRSWAGEVGERFLQKVPAGRFGYPEEVAGAAVYLASDAANLITGENLVMDGGYTIQ